jgi:bifunctional non-homologous end joining protein LigD
MTTLDGLSVEYYRRVAGPLVRHLAGVPLVTARYVDGSQPTFSASLHGPPPANEATVTVRASSGRVLYLALSETSLLYEAHRYALEVHSWSPRPDDPARVGFARVLVRPRAGSPLERSGWIADVLRRVLHARNCDGIALRDGAASVAVWVPFADGPTYDVLRLWLHGIVAAVVAAEPSIDAAELHIASNAAGHWSMVPYSLIGPDAATAMTPLRWAELATIGDALARDAVAARSVNCIFDEEVRRIGSQSFRARPVVLVSGEGHGQILAAVRAVLADAKPHSAAEICDIGIARGLLSATTIPAYVQHGIATLLDRQRDRGEKPEILILPDGSYRLNVPIDPYASFAEAPRDRSAIDPLIAELRASVVRDTPATPDDGPNIGAPFERAVAQAFAMLGLDTVRLGGEGQPDVVATAPLGSLMYRVAVECKTSASVKLHGSAGFVVEAARLRDAVGATYAVLLGLDFPAERGIDAELATHGVALWTIEDLIALLECQLDHPISWLSLRPLFAAGRVADAVVAFRGEHVFGAYKRARVALTYALQQGLAYQTSLATEGAAIDAPLTVDALTMLVNERMAREGMLGRCSTADIAGVVAVAGSPWYEAMEVGDGHVVIVRRDVD